MTIRQKQHLLAFLGYYTGAIDGQWGKNSRQAVLAFQRDHALEDDGIFGPETEAKIRWLIGSSDAASSSFWEEIRFFDRAEFACRCGKCGGFPEEPKETLIRTAERTRAHFGCVMVVSSGVRCEKHNAAVGGVANSRHLSGKAMDFRVVGKRAREVLGYVQRQPEIRYAYAIDEQFVHMDIQ